MRMWVASADVELPFRLTAMNGNEDNEATSAVLVNAVDLSLAVVLAPV